MKDIPEIKDWRKRMVHLGLPSSSIAYFTFFDICPACYQKEGDCPHCDSLKTYVGYKGKTEKKEVQQFQILTSRVLELYQEIDTMEKEYNNLKRRMLSLEKLVKQLAGDSIKELENLENVIVARKHKITLGKVMAWLHLIKDAPKNTGDES